MLLASISEQQPGSLESDTLSFLIDNLRRDYSDKTPSWHVVWESIALRNSLLAAVFRLHSHSTLHHRIVRYGPGTRKRSGRSTKHAFSYRGHYFGPKTDSHTNSHLRTLFDK